MTVTLHYLSGQMVAFERAYNPAPGELAQGFVFDLPLVNNLYEVALTPSWVMGGFEVTAKTINGFNLDWNNAAPLWMASTPTVTNAGAGNVNAGTHSWVVTFVTAGGEIGTSGQTASITALTNSQFSLTNIPRGDFTTTQRKIYRNSIANPNNFQLLTTITDNTTTTYTDNTADGSLGTAIPNVLNPAPALFLRVKR